MEAENNNIVRLPSRHALGFARKLELEGELESAEQIYRTIISSTEISGKAVVRYSRFLVSQKRFQDAERVIAQHFSFCRNYYELYELYVLSLELRSEDSDAIVQLRERQDKIRQDAVLWLVVGKYYYSAAKYYKATIAFRQSLQFDANLASSQYLLARTYERRGYFRNAIKHYSNVLEADPNFPGLIESLYRLYQYSCSYDEIDALRQHLHTLRTHNRLEDPHATEMIFHSVTGSTDAEKNLLVAKAYAAEVVGKLNVKKVLSHSVEAFDPSSPIVVGFLSSDYREHSVTYLISGLFRNFNRQTFKVIAFSIGRPDNSESNQLVRDLVDEYVDLNDMSDTAAARCIKAKNTGILVDLNGYTQNHRNAILAYRPAPIQVSYLGYLGTSGSDFIDYILTDRTVTPEDQAAYYSEKFAYVPGNFQIYDGQTSSLSRNVTREEFDLPDDRILFCCFAQAYKITEPLIDAWISILERADNALLLLHIPNSLAQENLSAWVRRKGGDVGQLVFTEALPRHQYLERLSVVDVVLDTPLYNGGTTSLDALSMGLPIVTTIGTSLASRMGASLLTTLKLDHLICADMTSYIDLAVKLATDSGFLAEMRQDFRSAIQKSGLLDSAKKTKQIEKLFETMWKRYMDGQTPEMMGIEN